MNAADAFDIGSFDEEDTKGIKVPGSPLPGLASGSSSPNMPGMGMERLLDQSGPSPPPSTPTPALTWDPWGWAGPSLTTVPILSAHRSCWTATRSSTATFPSPSPSGGSRRWQKRSSTPSTPRQTEWRPARKPKTSSWAMRKVRVQGRRGWGGHPLLMVETRRGPGRGHGKPPAVAVPRGDPALGRPG